MNKRYKRNGKAIKWKETTAGKIVSTNYVFKGKNVTITLDGVALKGVDL